MDLFKKQDFLKLADVHDKHCISIYIPTHRASGDNEELQDMNNFKNQLKEVKRKLQDYNLSTSEIEDYTKPLTEFLEKEAFWRRLSDGLAVFLHGDELIYYLLPENFESYNYVADHFYLKPLAPFTSSNERFFIMVLSLGNMRFFDASAHTLTEVDIEGLIPRDMEETIALVSDENQQALQWRSQHGEPVQGAMFHGHGGGNESEKKIDILKYFREIDRGLMEMLHDEKAPLIVVGVDYLFPLYKEANNYKYLYDHHLVGNFDVTSPQEIHDRVWDLVKDDFQADIEKKRDLYNELKTVDKASDKYEEVIPGSIVGRTDTLFLQKNKNVWGKYDATDHTVKLEEEKTTANACLLNKAAIGTIRNSGEVYLLEESKMPDYVNAAAIFRYEMK